MIVYKTYEIEINHTKKAISSLLIKTKFKYQIYF